jgi:hypothetical protein
MVDSRNPDLEDHLRRDRFRAGGEERHGRDVGGRRPPFEGGDPQERVDPAAGEQARGREGLRIVFGPRGGRGGAQRHTPLPGTDLRRGHDMVAQGERQAGRARGAVEVEQQPREVRDRELRHLRRHGRRVPDDHGVARRAQRFGDAVQRFDVGAADAADRAPGDPRAQKRRREMQFVRGPGQDDVGARGRLWSDRETAADRRPVGEDRRPGREQPAVQHIREGAAVGAEEQQQIGPVAHFGEGRRHPAAPLHGAEVREGAVRSAVVDDRPEPFREPQHRPHAVDVAPETRDQDVSRPGEK